MVRQLVSRVNASPVLAVIHVTLKRRVTLILVKTAAFVPLLRMTIQVPEVLAASVLIPSLVQPAIPNPVMRPHAKMAARAPMWTRQALHVTAKAALVVTHVKKLHVRMIPAFTKELVLSAKRMMARELLHVLVRQTSAEILAKPHLVARHHVKTLVHVK